MDYCGYLGANALPHNENWLGSPACATSIRRKLIACGSVFFMAFGLTCNFLRAESAGAQGSEQGATRGQPWLIPSPLSGVLMRSTVLRPPGAGPFPLAIINHASTQSAERRLDLPPPSYPALAGWFVRRGYAVVLPQRPGHGDTGGRYLEDQNGCADADFVAAGQGTAASIEAALAYMSTQSFVRRGAAVVVGVSAGGWGALALASRNPPGVRAVINFAGGRGGRSYERPGSNCAPDRLLDAARRFGSTARIPTLWLYAENDSYFPPALSRRLAEAFRAGGGTVEYRLLPAFGPEGHFLADADASEPLWSPLVQRFLDHPK